MNSNKVLKRFYQKVTYQNQEKGFGIFLDGDPAKTPLGRKIFVPHEGLAQILVDEFSAQKEIIKPEFMPFLRITNSVIDAIGEEWQILVEDLFPYISGDMMLYRATEPEALCQLERELWDPVVDEVELLLGVKFSLTAGVLPQAQLPEIIQAIRQFLYCYLQNVPEHCRGFIMASLHIITSLTHSILLAIAVLEGKISFKRLTQCAFLEEDWTAAQWGKDEEAEQKKAARIQELDAAFRMLSMLNVKLA